MFARDWSISYTPMNDTRMQDLAARLARGDEAAFAELYDACADGLHLYLVARLGSREAAADVLQTAFLRAVKSRNRFRTVENPVAYLYEIGRNEAAREACRNRRIIVQALPDEEVLADGNYACQQNDEVEMVGVALARLNAVDRETVELKIYGGLTFREIANIVGRPQATVATQYRRALESLRGWLTRQTK